MRFLLSLLILGPCASYAEPSAAPFGIELGKPLPPGFAKKHSCKTKTVAGGATTRFCDSAPKRLQGAENYMLLLYKGNVVKVLAVWYFTSDSFGTQLKSKFADIKQALAKKGGVTPISDFNFLQAGSIWGEPNEFARALQQNERHLAVYWSWPNGVDVSVSSSATTGSDTMMKLVYEHSALMTAYVAAQKIQDADAL